MPGLGLRWEVAGVPAGIRRLEHREVRVERTDRPAAAAPRVHGAETLNECLRSARKRRHEEAAYRREAVKDKWRLRGLDARPEDAREAIDDCPPETHPDDDEYAPTENGR